MKYGMRIRILSLVLCVCVILPIVAQTMPVFSADTSNGANGTTNYGAAIGAVAEWDVESTLLASNHYESNSDVRGGISVSELPQKLTIVNYAYDDVNEQLWYKVDAAPGYTWPEEYENYHWVYDYSVKIVSQNGMTGVFDADGNAVTELTMPLYDKIPLVAESSLQGSVKYQWQIEYEDGEWVDIYGENEAKITLSIGMIATLLVYDTVNVRCISSSASKSAVSDPVAITVDFDNIGGDSSNSGDDDEFDEPTDYVNITVDGVESNTTTIEYDDYNYDNELIENGIKELAFITSLAGDYTISWQARAGGDEDGAWEELYNGTDTTFELYRSGLTGYFASAEVGSVAYVRVVLTQGETVAESATLVVSINERNPLLYYGTIENNVTTTDGNTVDVTVAGSLPDDAILNLENASDTTVSGVEADEIALALDVTITQNGVEWQPAEGEVVYVSIPAYKLGLEDGQYFTVYHIHDGETELLGPFKVEDGAVTFEIDGFSVVVISTNYGAAIGGVAEFAGSSVILDSGAVNFAGTTVWVEDANLPAKVVIKNYVFDDYLGKLFYEIDAAPGYTWPEAYADLHWCYSDALTNIDVNGEAGVYDEGGNIVANANVSATESVTVKVETSLQSADIDYKWQICYDTANDLWVDITGETSAEITLTAGMIASLMDENNQALVRCVTTVGSKSVTSDPITVTLHVPDSGETEEPKLEIQIDGTSADSVDVNDADKLDFNSVLSANTNLSGELTYSWEVLYDTTNDIWEVLGTDATFAPCFDAYGDGVWIRSYYIHYVDANTDALSIRLNVSNGVTTLTDTFTINVKYEEVETASYSVYGRMASASAYSNSGIATTAETTTTYNVIINYLNEDGTATVADPYTSVVSPTTILTNTISFPKIVGYVPMVYDEARAKWVRQDTYTFDGTPFTEDFILNVRYYPDAVDYTVNIYVQNAENDQYTLYTSYVRQELTGTMLKQITFNISGYYQSKFSSNHAAIAADGSTVFNLYYDRIYYLMKFDLDGGYGVQPIYARHGVKLDIPNPTKAGYTFVGWDQTEGIPADNSQPLNDGIANTMYEYMPIGNTAYKAIWEAVENAKVTIVYWGENPNDENYSYLESQEIYVKPGTTLTFGTDQLVCTLTPHAHEDDCTYNCGITHHNHSLENNCYTLNCDIESHNHTESGCTLKCTHTHELSCYSVPNGELKETTKPDQINNYTGNGVYSYTRQGMFGERTEYYLYFNGKWYCSAFELDLGFTTIFATEEITISCGHVHSNLCWDCGLNEGTHVHRLDQGCYTLTCTTEAHTHTDDCYSCIAHTHTDDCYLKTDSQDSALWTYVKSDTVTVAADGSTVMNVYYDRTTFTITFKETNGDGGDTLGTITDKWGADIRTRFENECKEHTFLWSQKTNGDSPWTSFLDVMPQENRTYYAKTTSSNNTQTAIYYGADQSGEYNILLYTSAVKYGDTLTVSAEEFIEIEGYVFAYGIDGDETRMNTPGKYGAFDGAVFYYDRARFNLEFNNGEGIVRTESVLYEANLGSYEFTPTAPSKYEQGSVEFAGWYQNPECTGKEVVLSSTTMPATNMVLYAKWIPVKHDVTIYRYKNADGTFPTGNDILYDTFEVSHGSLVQSSLNAIPEDPENGNYTFVTWAYYDAEKGEEVEITLDSFVVTKDVEIYAKWSSNVQVPYTIKYMIQGTTTEIAPATEGKHYAGETHTFNAKTGGQLNADYQTGYFPTVTSHSIDFKDDVKSYEYIFYYAKKDSVPYTVYYVTTQQNEENSLDEIKLTENGVEKTYYIVANTKQVNDNINAIVTENFAKVNGYMPDAYQKTLIIDGSESAVNQIIFVYSVNTTQAYYKVTHWVEQTDGSWFAHSSYENKGTIGDTINENPVVIEGFTYSNTTYKVGDNEPTDTNSPLTADGLEIDLYYKRNKYPYTVEYREQGTENLLYTVPNLENQYYGATVEATAPEYWENGVYKRISAEKLNTVIQTDETKNVITFYYTEQEVTINYVVANGIGGTVNPTQETVLIQSGIAQGSVAEPLSSAYKFVGWYDEEGKLVGTNPEFKPAKVNGLNVAATYYAKFEYNLTSLTIKKQGHDSVDENQTFLFKLTDEDGLELTVTVHGNGSVTVDGLTVGKKYKIEEITEWSWRYTNNGIEKDSTTVVISDSTIPNGAEFTLNPTENVIAFTNERSNPCWLDGDSWCNNIFNN